MRETTEVIVGAVTGSVAAPSSLLLGRFDNDGRLQYVGRTTTLAQPVSSAVAGLLAPARRASLEGLVVLFRVGQPGDAERHAGGGSRRRGRP
ncbi:hypothetical protein [Streptomyces sp. NBC_01314]|uniref:hypothetical protein n=1 Tax=Streptomyces sp. NBC_01314 TaxID=2903821 RepID=UPI00309079BD|nr:hypothetical protein OG622_34100 [Streptomyces sp. NBC_01314]